MTSKVPKEKPKRIPVAISKEKVSTVSQKDRKKQRKTKSKMDIPNPISRSGIEIPKEKTGKYKLHLLTKVGDSLFFKIGDRDRKRLMLAVNSAAIYYREKNPGVGFEIHFNLDEHGQEGVEIWRIQ